MSSNLITSVLTVYVPCLPSLSFGIQDMKPSEITYEKALELLLGDKVRTVGRPPDKTKVADVEAL